MKVNWFFSDRECWKKDGTYIEINVGESDENIEETYDLQERSRRSNRSFRSGNFGSGNLLGVGAMCEEMGCPYCRGACRSIV